MPTRMSRIPIFAAPLRISMTRNSARARTSHSAGTQGVSVLGKALAAQDLHCGCSEKAQDLHEPQQWQEHRERSGYRQ